MAIPEHVEIVREGKDAIHAWRENNPGASLNLGSVDLRDVDLIGANLGTAYLCDANLSRAKLHKAGLIKATLVGANLSEADLTEANLYEADLRKADLSDADLSDADLKEANLRWANLSRTELLGAHLSGAILCETNLNQANLVAAGFIDTVFGDVDLSVAVGLENTFHHGPSSIGIDTLRMSKGKIPDDFLRGCGLQPWEVLNARLYDLTLNAAEIKRIQDDVLVARNKDEITGAFISYAWGSDEDGFNDTRFVDKLRKKLGDEGIYGWVDRHDMVSGDMARQVNREIKRNQVVIVVLSKWSVDSDWVEHELETARNKEKAEKRDVLCPVALDDSWKSKVDGDPLWRQLKKKLVVDFSKWKTKAFEAAFQTLLDGLKKNY